MDPPKSRPLVVEAHILAYLGQYMNIFEKQMRERILKEAEKISESKIPSKPNTTKPLSNTQ